MNKQNRNREYFDGCQMGGALEGWAKQVKGLRNSNWLPQNSHEDVKYNIGNIVSNNPTTVYGVRWVQDLLG